MPDAAGCLVLSVLLSSSVFATLVVAVAGLAMRFARAVGTPAEHAVWTAALAGMLLAPLLAAALPAVYLPVLPSLGDGARQSFRETVGVSYFSVLVALYLAVALARVARLAGGLLAVQRLVCAAAPVRDARLLELAGALGARGVRLLASPALDAPVTAGIVTPAVLLPGDWVRWDDERLRGVLAHELAHARRRDPASRFVAQLALCVFWFHPLAWWLVRRAAEVSERAADDAAVLACGSRARYARLLLELAADARPAGRFMETCGMARTGPDELSRRVDSILDHTRARRVVLGARPALALLAGSLLLAAILAPLRLVAATERAAVSAAAHPAGR